MMNEYSSWRTSTHCTKNQKGIRGIECHFYCSGEPPLASDIEVLQWFPASVASLLLSSISKWPRWRQHPRVVSLCVCVHARPLCPTGAKGVRVSHKNWHNKADTDTHKQIIRQQRHLSWFQVRQWIHVNNIWYIYIAGWTNKLSDCISKLMCLSRKSEFSKAGRVVIWHCNRERTYSIDPIVSKWFKTKR